MAKPLRPHPICRSNQLIITNALIHLQHHWRSIPYKPKHGREPYVPRGV